jgi:hypothetical protein
VTFNYQKDISGKKIRIECGYIGQYAIGAILDDGAVNSS